jgi:hypothetical protein
MGVYQEGGKGVNRTRNSSDGGGSWCGSIDDESGRTT